MMGQYIAHMNRIVIGFMMNDNDILEVISTEPQETLKFFYNPKLDEDGKPIWPTKINAVCVELSKPSLIHTYILQTIAFKEITVFDDNTVGHCKCANCDQSVGLADKYCRSCGAKFKFKHVINGK